MPVVTDHLAAQYLLREGSGTVAHDTSGNGLDGTLSGSPGWSSNGILFSSGSDQIYLPNAVLANDDISITDVSIEVWVKPTNSSSTGYVVNLSNDLSLYQSGAFYQVDVYTNAGNTFAGGIGSNTAADTASFHHLVFVRSGDAFSLYVDGVLDFSTSGNGTGAVGLSSADGTKEIGSGGTRSFLGFIGEVRIYSKALSSAEVTQNYAASNTYSGGAPSITSFSAFPSPVAPGQGSTLSWSVTGATSISINNGVGSPAGTSVSVFPTVTTSYTLTATNSSGTVTATATVTVGSNPATQSILIDNGTQTMAMRTIKDGDKLWSVGHTTVGTPATRPVVCMSSDGGETWAVQDDANAGINPSNAGDLNGSVMTAYDEVARRVWFGYFHAVEDSYNPTTQVHTFYSFFEFQTFELSTGKYSAVFGSAVNRSGLYYDVNYPYQESVAVSGLAAPQRRFGVGIHLLDSNNILVFTQAQAQTFSSINAYDLQLQVSTYSFSGADPSTGGWSSPIASFISENCPAGTTSVPVQICCLGGSSDNGSFYFFYSFLQIDYPNSGDITEAVYFRSVDAGGAVSTPVTVSAASLCNHGTVISQRVRVEPPSSVGGLFNGMNPLDPLSGRHFHSWISFRYCYVRNGVLYTTAIYNHPTLGYTPCVVTVDLSSNAITYTPISSSITGLWEAVMVPSGNYDVIALVQKPTGSTTPSNLIVSINMNDGSGWGALQTLDVDSSEINYPWPVYTPSQHLTCSYWISLQTRFRIPYPYAVVPTAGNAFMFSRLSNLHLAFPATSPGSYIT